MISKEYLYLKLYLKPIDDIEEVGWSTRWWMYWILLRSWLKKGFRSTRHDDGYNARRNLELMGCHQSFKCKGCDTKSNVEGDLNIHEETTHGDWFNDSLSWTQKDYYYDFYGFNEDCHKKIDSSEEVIAKPGHDNH